jgi:hypothetical protein
MVDNTGSQIAFVFSNVGLSSEFDSLVVSGVCLMSRSSVVTLSQVHFGIK